MPQQRSKQKTFKEHRSISKGKLQTKAEKRRSNYTFIKSEIVQSQGSKSKDKSNFQTEGYKKLPRKGANEMESTHAPFKVK